MSLPILSQALAVSRLSLSGAIERPGPSLVIVLGVACVVAVLLSVLSVASGLSRAYVSGADPRNAIVLAAESVDEGGSSITRDTCAALQSAPGLSRDNEGRSVVDCEVLLALPPARGFAEGTLFLRGVGTEAFAVRPRFEIVDGRNFRTGMHEMIVGIGAESVFGLKIGDAVILPDGEWRIVGAFSSGGGTLESELVSDAATVMASARSDHFNSVLVRLEKATAFSGFEQWISADPSLSVFARRQEEFYRNSAAPFMGFFTSLAYFVGTILAIGAFFGSLNVMLGTVRARTREIVVLRALGFHPLPIALSILIEAMVLSLLGALIGAGCAWLLFSDKQSLMVHTIFHLSITPNYVAIAFGWALAISLAGALPPALRAVGMSITMGMRER